MNVPPFFPQQIEIPGNVAEEPYAVRIRFVKRVVLLHGLSVCALLLFAVSEVAPPHLGAGLTFTLGAMLGLSLVRGLVRRWRHEQLLSFLFIFPLFVGISVLVRVAVSNGMPLGVFALPTCLTLAYVAACGKDLSFLGMFVMTTLGSVALFVAANLMHWLTGVQTAVAVVGCVGFLLYFVYDLAALQTRRRVGQELGGVMDLYRDPLNFTTYPIRVVRHWRRHRIWSART